MEMKRDTLLDDTQFERQSFDATYKRRDEIDTAPNETRQRGS